ncbi:MAG: AsmA family protein [Candidatus Parcubacteria bacterium]|nr:AsmA family protein [Burkholderiales bacterium]
MRKTFLTWRPFLIAGGVLLASVIAAVVTLALFDWNHARGWVASWVSERTGRTLSIAGNLEVKPFSFNPRVRAEQVSFANAEWGEQQPMLEADTVDFRVNLFSLLRGPVTFPEVMLGKARVLLQRDEGGQRNWILKPPGRTDEGQSPQIHRLTVNEGLLTVKDKMSDTDAVVQLQSATHNKYTLNLIVNGRVRGVPVQVKGSGGGLLALQDDGSSYPLKLSGKVGGGQMSAEGNISGIASLQAVDAQLSLSGSDLAPLGDLLNISLPRTKPYKLSGNLQRRGTQWSFSKFRGTVGASDLGGEFSVDTRTGPERPVLKANLASAHLDIADLGGFVGAVPGTGPAVKAPGRILPSRPFNLEKLNRVDAYVKLVATRFQNRDKLPLDNLDATLNLENGVFKLAPIVFGVAGGKVNSTVVVNATEKTLRTSIDSAFRKLHLNQLIPGTDKLDASFGAVDGRAKLAGTGDSIAAILASSAGRVDLYSGGGKVSNLLMEFAGADIAEIVKFWVGGDKQIQLRCAVASFEVKNGLMDAETLVVDTDDTVIGGKGGISLRDESYDLTLTPLPKDFSILSLRGPLRVTGSFAKPNYGLEKAALARKVGASLLLGLINPLAAIVPLIETGPGKDAPCASLVASVQAAAKQPAPRAPPPALAKR